MQTEQLLRGQIVAAALELFREKGYHSTTLMDIITAAKCSKGGFYHHFASKEDLLCCIHESFITYELEKGEAVRQSRGTAGDRLRRVIIDLVESIELYRPHVTVFFEERRFLSSDKFAQVKEKRDQYEAIIKQLVIDGIKSGEFRNDLDYRIVTMAVFGMCNWTYQWLRMGGGFSASQVGEMFSSLILRGLETADPDAGADRSSTGQP